MKEKEKDQGMPHGFPPNTGINTPSLRSTLTAPSSKSAKCWIIVYRLTMLVCLGCYDKYLRQGGSNNKHLFLTVLKAGKSKIKASGDAVCGEGMPPS